MKTLLMALFLSAISISATAAAAMITNGSFESASVDPGAGFLTLIQPSTVIDGWTVTDSAVDYVGTLWDASDGLRSLDLGGSIGQAGGVEQMFSTSAGTTYEVLFDMSGNWGGAPTIKTLSVSADGQSADFTFDITGRSANNMGWENNAWTFTADDGLATLKFKAADTNFGPAIDNVSITAVPVPASAWLFGSALGLLGWMRRKAA